LPDEALAKSGFELRASDFEFIDIMLTNKKPIIEKFLDPLTKPLSGVNPNLLTLLGSIPPILFFVFVINGNYLLALIAFLGSGIDMLDGMIARKYKKTSNFGGFLDSTLDRISDFLVITAFAFGGLVSWEIIAPLLLLAFLTSYIRAQGGLRSGGDAGFALGVGLIERTERFLFIIFALLAYMLFPSTLISSLNLAEIILLLLTLLSLYTVLQRLNYARKKL
jgi:archaetidylinositol phosphate synthase